MCARHRGFISANCPSKRHKNLAQPLLIAVHRGFANPHGAGKPPPAII
jgi:hypothetical protein